MIAACKDSIRINIFTHFARNIAFGRQGQAQSAEGGVECFVSGNLTGKRDDLLVNILFDSQTVESKGEARRLITQNAVSVVDGDKLSDMNLKMDDSFAGKVLKVGKRKFLRLK